MSPSGLYFWQWAQLIALTEPVPHAVTYLFPS